MQLDNSVSIHKSATHSLQDWELAHAQVAHICAHQVKEAPPCAGVEAWELGVSLLLRNLHRAAGLDVSTQGLSAALSSSA